MSKKALYNLIEMNYRAANFVLPKGINLSNKRHTSGGRYFLFELPMEKKIPIDDLDLISYHVSVYEAPTGKIDLKSQYHFTAFFQNASGEEYRLHVFFDAGDGLVIRPMLSVLKGDKYEPVESDDLDEVFTNLATTACSDLVTFLRAFQKNRVVTLQHQFEVLENRLESLSPDLVKNKKEYLKVITGQIEVLEELGKISNKAPDVIKQKRWLIATKEIIESGEFNPEPVSNLTNHGNLAVLPEDKTKEQEPSSISVKSKQKKSLKVKTVNAPPMLKIKPAISDEVLNLKLRYIVATGLEGVNQANLVSELYTILKEKEWQLEFKERSATIQDLNDLRVLKASIEKLAGKLLQRFLLQSDFNNAELLNQFYHLLSDSISLFALQGNRHKLLDFLLKHNIVQVNFKNFTINNMVYSSLVDYFFNGPGSDASKIACLDVLIKREASLMGIDQKSGLPYAALLLSQQNHPLRAVLEQNQELTLSSVAFHSSMNHVLRSLNPSAVTINLVELIAYNKDTIFLLRKKIAPYKPHDKKLESSLGQDLAHQIQTDPEISYQSRRIRKEVALLLPKVAPLNKRKFIDLTDMNFNLLAKKLNGINNPELIPPFEDLKRETVKLQLIILEYIALVNEAYAQNETVARVNRYSRKEIKGVQGISKRRSEIDARIIEMKGILTNAYTDLLREQSQKSPAKVSSFTKNLLAGVSKDTKSDEDEGEKEDVTDESLFRSGLRSTFFTSDKSTDNAFPDTEDSSNESQNISLQDENELEKNDTGFQYLLV